MLFSWGFRSLLFLDVGYYFCSWNLSLRKEEFTVIQVEAEKAAAPNREFAQLAADEQIERTAKALEARNIKTLIAENAEEAKQMFFALVPEGAEVFLCASVTLETLGIKDEIDKLGKINSLRPKM